VTEIMPQRTTAEWLEILDRYKLWAGPVYTYADLVQDPHVQETGMVTSVNHPTIGPLRMPNVPLKMSDTPAEIRLPPPGLGEQTDSVLQEILGYDNQRLQQLHAAGAI
jgi:crotonobetainyl-CoA:carnitine CoA-transferase CaiB-like acyl-CoA transferase